MTDFPSFLTTALAVVSIATLAGLGLLRGTVTNLREQLHDARSETTALRETREDERREAAAAKADWELRFAAAKADYEKQLATMAADSKAKIAILTADLDALRRTVTGEVHWVALEEDITAMRDDLKAHHGSAAKHWTKDEKTSADILAALEKLGPPDAG